MKRALWVILALVVVGGLVAASMAGESGLEVDVGQVTRGELDEGVTEEGRTRVRQRYVVASPVTGLLARIELRPGDAVEAGAVVARVYPSPESSREVGVGRAQVSAAEARRRGAGARVRELSATVRQREADVARIRRLVAGGSLPRSALEEEVLRLSTTRRQLEATRAADRAARADVTLARAAIVGAAPAASGAEPAEVRAPTGGRVLELFEESERVVVAGAPLIAVGDARQLEVVVDVLSEDAVAVRPGHMVRVQDWGGAGTLSGTVRFIEPEAFTETSALGIQEQRVNIVCDLDDPPASLGARYRVEARLITWSAPDVVRVPTSALFQRDSGQRVFVLSGGVARLREVETGHRNSEHAEVLSGLEEGEQVVLFPSDQVEDGVEVREAG